MIKKAIICLILPILLQALPPKSTFGEHTFEDEISEPNTIAINVIDQTAKELKNKYNLIPSGFVMKPKLEYLGIDFFIRKSIDKMEARKILFDSAEIFLNNINSNKKMLAILKGKKFTPEQVGIVLYITDEDGYDLPHPNLSVARFTAKKILFRTDDPLDKFKYKENSEETYEEALQILKDSGKNIEGLSFSQEN